MKKLILLTIVIVILSAITYLVISETGLLNRNNSIIPKVNFNLADTSSKDIPRTSVIASNLSVPWDIAFLPDKRMIITEREGNVKIIDGSNIETIATINTLQSSESGLHGIAVDPEFESNNNIYLYYTTNGNGGNTLNRVSKYKFLDNTLNDETILVDKIPGANIHDGGRIRFGPDGYLYITTGDAANPSSAQDTNSLAGKILKVDTNGDAVPGNPFGNLVYSYGHRNPQGITWDSAGQLFETEHGNNATDEFNKIEMGKNYGWPTIRGDEKNNTMVSPLIQSESNTWAPAGLSFINGKFYFAGLRGNALYEVEKTDNGYSLKEFFSDEFGRIRAVTTGPDGMLYISTSNKDGRGIASFDDDKIIRVNPEKL